MPNILVIDDEADMRFAVRMLLERSGHHVIEADSGDAALAKLDESKPDLVLLDMRLPGMDGIQILQKLREKEKDLPIIMVTGYGNVELAEEAIKQGADHYLSKPFHNKELIEVIQQILEKRGYVLPLPSRERTEVRDGLLASEEEGHPSSQPSPLKGEGDVGEVEPDRSPFAKVLLIGTACLGAVLLWWFSQPRAFYPVPYSNPTAIVFMDKNARQTDGGRPSGSVEGVWIADWFSQAIYIHELHRRELALKRTYYLPDVHLTGMAVTPNAVYTADSWAHVLRKHRLDDHLSVALTVPSPGPSPCSLFWDGKYLWSCDLSTGKIYQHQADDQLTVVASYSSPGKAPVGFYKDDRYAWSMDAKSRKLYQRRLDNQLTVIATYELPEWQEGVAPLASFTWRDDDLWFTRTGKNLIYRRSKTQLVEVKP